ncbi:MAG: FAD:protein FMN transferase [Methanobacteriota archaeon]
MEKNIFIPIIVLLLASGCVLNPQSSEYSETRNLIGTFITVTVYSQDENSALKAINSSFERMSELGDELSHYSKTNQVFQLNSIGFGNLIPVSSDLGIVINKSLQYSELSDGAFDVTVQPLVNLWSRVGSNGSYPKEFEVELLRGFVDYRNLEFNGSHAWFKKYNMSVTFGGIAKGYIVDQGLEVLRSMNVSHALINAGGDIGVYGGKPGGGGWSLALQNPRDKSDYITVIEISDGAVATSGDYERYYTEDKKVHHIIDPRTGYSATELISATIIAPTATDADALSTAVFVLGPEEGLRLVESLDGIEALVITEDKEIKRSSGFRF